MSILTKTVNLDMNYPLGKTKVPVLRDVCCEIEEGSVVALIGASGSGKTTLLNIMGGLDTPVSGKVYFRNIDVHAMTEPAKATFRARNIGFVFQSYYLLPDLDVLENVTLPGKKLNNGFANKRLADRALVLLDKVGLSERAGHLPSELSGGEQQRAALARAMINEPELLLADEPTGNLDVATGNAVLEHMFNFVRNEKRTLLLATHNMELAKKCDKVLELKDGKM
ncbi:MAG: ABC transporter ATP-binding protein, partial [Lentisphaerae bacterium]|nr:ABC transporter ATP-binding protein [Lentisphaerota bacterium]